MQPVLGRGELSRVSGWEVLAQARLFVDARDHGTCAGMAGKLPATRWGAVARLRDDPDANVRNAFERILQKAGRLGPLSEAAKSATP